MFSKNKKIIQISSIIFLVLISMAVGLIFMQQRSSSTTPMAEAALAATTTPVDRSSPTQVPETLLAPTETPSPEPTDIPSPNISMLPTRSIEITRTSIMEEEGTEGVRYDLSETVHVYRMLPNGNFIGHTNDGTLVIVDLDDASIDPLLDNTHPKSITPPQSDYIFVPAYVLPDQPAPIWATNVDGNDLILLGITSNSQVPVYSSTADGRVLLLEEGHLILKWIEDGIVRSQSLDAIEENLPLNWATIDWAQPLDWVTKPLIDMSISPDGQRVALFDGSQGKLWVVSIDGQIIRDVDFPFASTEGSSWVTFLDWSPDSQWLGYQSTLQMEVFRQIEYFSVVRIISVDNGYPVTLTPSGMTSTNLKWSPNGQHLAFTAHDGNTSDYHLFVANSDGTDAQLVSNVYLDSIGQTLYWESEDTLTYKCQEPGIEGYRPDICTTKINR